jgi:hypothetical protein
MKLTAKQLRQIISEEAGRLDEMFTPAGGIGFGDIPRPGRRSYLDLPIMGETDEVDEAEQAHFSQGMTIELQALPMLERMNALLAKIAAASEEAATMQAELTRFQDWIKKMAKK